RRRSERSAEAGRGIGRSGGSRGTEDALRHRERQAPLLPREGGRRRGGLDDRAPRRTRAGIEGRGEADVGDRRRAAHQGDGQVSTTPNVESESALDAAPETPTAEVEVPAQYRKSAAPMTGKIIIELKNVTKTFVRAKEPLTVLDGLTLDVYEGALEALMGPSGSGKTTLLNL